MGCLLLTEYNETETMELFKEEGRQEGREEGENKLARLVEKLLSNGKSSEISMVLENKEYRNKMYLNYGIA